MFGFRFGLSLKGMNSVRKKKALLIFSKYFYMLDSDFTFQNHIGTVRKSLRAKHYFLVFFGYFKRK